MTAEVISVDNYVKKLETQTQDLKDAKERAGQELEMIKKKYNEAKVEAQTAF